MGQPERITAAELKGRIDRGDSVVVLSSPRVAQTLLQRGWRDARPLLGGFDAWRRAGYPVEPKKTLVPTR